MKNLDKTYKKEREKLRTLILDIGMKQKPYVKNYPLGQLETNLWHWHIESQKRLLERVGDEVIGKDFNIASSVLCDDINRSQGILTDEVGNTQRLNDFLSQLRSKLQSLIKDLEETK